MHQLRKLLFPLSVIYGLIMRLRNLLYDLDFLKSRSYNLPIICVGNLNTGGTGKTPHIEYLIRLLKNHQVAVVSRGYGRNTKGLIEVQLQSEASQVGDEPLQIKKKFPAIRCVVCEKRSKGIDYLMSHHPEVEVILLDDAFQHRSVKAGLNILLTQYDDLYVNDLILPAGNLREPATGAARAQIIIVTKSPSTLNPTEKAIIKNQLKTLLPVFFSTLKYDHLQHFYEEKIIKLSELRDYEILLITGIASSKKLFDFLNSQSKKIIEITYNDHHEYCEKDFSDITAKFNTFASTKKIIVTTEKDAVKLRSEKFKKTLGHLPVFFIPVTITINENESELLKLVESYVGKNQNHS
jgi:tetraacyldisaccharide 4'-kinase